MQARYVLLLVYAASVAIIEGLQCYWKQDIKSAVIDTSFLCLCLSTVMVFNLSSFFIFAVVVFGVAEVYCFYYLGKPLNEQFFSFFIDPFYAAKEHVGFLIEGIVASLIVIMIVFLPMKRISRGSKNKQVSKSAHVLLYLLLLLGYFFTDKVIRGVIPFGHETFLAGQDTEIARLDRYFNTPVTSSVKKGKKPKNLIYVMGESLERQILGEFNQMGFNRSMPFLSSLANSSTLCTNLIPQEYTTWSVAATYASMCGLPLVVKNPKRNANKVRYMLKGETGIKCIGDILTSAGYYGMSIFTGVLDFGNEKQMLLDHGFKDIYDHKHRIINDWRLMRELGVHLPRLADEYKRQNKPFFIFLGFQDTHPRYTVDHCHPRTDIVGDVRGMQAFDCTDQRFEKLMNMVKDAGLTAENTEIVIHGDHTLMTSCHLFTKGDRWNRELFAVFPFHKQKRITKQITHYDIAPTLLDYMNINYEPKFPFGTNVDHPEESQPPSRSAIDYLFSRLTQ